MKKLKSWYINTSTNNMNPALQAALTMLVTLSYIFIFQSFNTSISLSIERFDVLAFLSIELMLVYLV